MVLQRVRPVRDPARGYGAEITLLATAAGGADVFGLGEAGELHASDVGVELRSVGALETAGLGDFAEQEGPGHVAYIRSTSFLHPQMRRLSSSIDRESLYAEECLALLSSPISLM